MKTGIIRKIVKESTKVLIFTAILSTVGGIGLEYIQSNLVRLVPLLILLPGLNNMVGDFGIVISSRFTTMLYLGQIKRKGDLFSKQGYRLLKKIWGIAFLSAVYLSALAYAISLFKGGSFNLGFFIKLVSAIILITLTLVVSLSFVLSMLGLYLYKKGKDPNNYLIPIATSISDLGSLILFTIMVILFF